MKKREIGFLLGLLIFSILFRFYNIEKWSLDIDETFTIEESNKSSLAFFKDYLLLNNHIFYKEIKDNKFELLATGIARTYPIYYLINKNITNLFGIKEFSLRLQSAIWGIIAVGLVFIFGIKYFNLRLSIILSLLILFHPLTQFHSQNARPYSFAFLLSIVVLILSKILTDMLGQDSFGTKKIIAFILLGTILPLFLSVHLTVTFSLVLIPVLILSNKYKYGAREIFKRLAFFLIPFFFWGGIVAINQIYMFSARFELGTAVGGWNEVLGSQLIYKVLSMISNFGLVFFLILPLSERIIKNSGSHLVKGVFKTLIVGLCLYMILAGIHEEVRFDYIFVLLPFLLVVIAFTIEFGTIYFLKATVAGKTFFLVAVTTVLIIVNIPAFISNLIIDGNRLNWREAGGFFNEYRIRAQNRPKVDVYTVSPDNLKFYLGKNEQIIDIKSLSRLEITDNASDKGNRFVIVPLRRVGIDFAETNRDIANYVLRHGTIQEIIGKNRLDVQIVKLIIFKI